ncbi:MAG TPA: Xaa-Pro peptidase family protein [Candidatus Polarisedimenticolaceae bacterium]|nr:Xaa-Pro peptidase family protein [Candidatus Polarisedimenticolaceae bacterium]
MIPVEHHRAALVPAEEIARRITGFQRRLQGAAIDVAWIDHLTDRLYLSGSAQSGVLLVPASGPPVFHVRKSHARATAEARVAVRPYAGRAELFAALGGLARGEGRVGLALDVTPAATLLAITERTGLAVADVTAPIRLERARKSPWELEQLAGAARQITTLLDGIADAIRPGVSELALTGTVEGRLRAAGHGGTVRVRRPGTDIAIATVVSGTSAFYPTAFDGPVGAPGPTPPTPAGGGFKPLVAGETVMLDVVSSYNGYHVDTTRCFFLGRNPPDVVLRAHDRCRELLRRVVAALRPGARCDAIYREATAWAAAAGEPPGFMGYGENRVRFLGHGVGLELDELPVLADKIETRLEPGMVVAVEPKAFVEPYGPVGVENTYVVTDGEARNLCPLADDLIAL